MSKKRSWLGGRQRAKAYSSQRWGIDTIGVTGTQMRNRKAAKIRSVRRVGRAFGSHLPGHMLAHSSRRNLATVIRAKHRAYNRSTAAGHAFVTNYAAGRGKAYRSAKQRAQSRINGAKNRGRR